MLGVGPQLLEVHVKRATGPERVQPHAGHGQVAGAAAGRVAASPAGADEQAGEFDDRCRFGHHRGYRSRRLGARQMGRRHLGHQRDAISGRDRFKQTRYHFGVGAAVGEEHHLLAGADTQALVQDIRESVTPHGSFLRSGRPGDPRERAPRRARTPL